MIRTAIQLTDAQARAMRRIAAERGVSIAALLREAADWVAASPSERQLERARAAVGAYSSGLRDVSKEHDRYLAEP